MLEHGICLGLALGILLAVPAGRSLAQDTALNGSASTPHAVFADYAFVTSAPVPAGEEPSANHGSLVLSVGDSRITVQSLDTLTTSNGIIWSGIVQESGENALLMWWNDGRLTGELSYRGDHYTVATLDDKVHVALEASRQRMADHAPNHLRQSADARPRDNRAVERNGAERKPQRLAYVTPNIKPFTDAELRTLQANKVEIDLLVLYSRRAATHYMNSMADLIGLAVRQINVSFRNSGLENISLRLVQTQMLDYDETDSEHFDHLYRMVDGIGPFKQVRSLREETRADIVGLIVDDPSGCGLSTRVAPDPEEAFFVVHHSCAMTTFSIAHEIGHILGARHDRHTDAIDSPFPYGHGYVNGTKWRDIMSYQQSCEGCRRIPYWSNPRIKYHGEPTGTDANDSARVILEQAARVAHFR
jgi:Metallo-peptidase family M12